MRVLVLGIEGAGKSAIINKLKYGDKKEIPATKGFNVTTIDQNNNRFQLWELGGDQSQKGFWKQYTQNTQGVIYVLDSSSQDKYDDVKHDIQEIITETQLSGVPLLVYANKVDKGGNLNEITERLGLPSISDREWTIQGCETTSGGAGVLMGFEWIAKTMMNKNKQYTFEAQPKVVKSHTKYRQNEVIDPAQKSQITFTNLMKDQRIISLDPNQQEQEYIKQEKERLKLENMNNQLLNFKKNKKRMTPYDIKPSTNPRIEVNLDFFLTDHKNTIKPEQNTTDCQTDEFLKRPLTPPYIPKKTGIDCATQVEDYELFDFDREVTPIVDVIITKTLEQSRLEIEQEEEIKKMIQFKKEYEERRKMEKSKQAQVLEQEIELIKQKNQKLEKYVEKEEIKISALRRAQCYKIGSILLHGLKENCFESLYKTGFFQNNFSNQLKGEFMDWVVQETEKQIQMITDVNQNLNGIFDEPLIPTVMHQKDNIVSSIAKKKAKAQQRRFNDSKNKRMITIFRAEGKCNYSSFNKNFTKFLDGSLDEYNKNYQAKLQELTGKLDVGEIQKEELDKIMEQEFPDKDPIYQGYGLGKLQKIAFTLSHNKFYKIEQNQVVLSLMALLLNKEGEVVKQVDKQNLKEGKFAKYKFQIRDYQKKVNDDEAIIINLQKIPEDVASILLFVKVHNLQQLAPQVQTHDGFRFSRFGLEEWKYCVEIDTHDIPSNYKIEEAAKPPTEENPDEEQNYLILSYLISRKSQNLGWQLEPMKIGTKGLFAKKELPDMIKNICKFWAESDGTPKVNLEQPEQQDNQEAIIKDNIMVKSQNQLETPIFAPSIYELFEVQFEEKYEDLKELILQKIKQYDPEFTQQCQHGIEIFVKKDPFARSKQLKKVKNVVDLQIKKVPEPVVVEQPQDENIQDGQQEDGDQNQENQEEEQ